MRKALPPLWGFLHGWTLFTIIQTGTIAAVAVAFAPFSGVLRPWIGEEYCVAAPIHLSAGCALSLSGAQFLGILVITLLTWTNRRGLEYGKVVKNIFTTAKTGALLRLIAAGLFLGWKATAAEVNFGNLRTPRGYDPIAVGPGASNAFGPFAAICVAQTGLCLPQIRGMTSRLLRAK